MSDRHPLPGQEAVLRAALAERLARAGTDGVAAGDLVAGLGGDWSERAVRRALDALAADGEAAVWNRRWLAVSATDWVVGVVERGADGKSWLRTGPGGQDLRLRQADLKGARSGDRVLARPVGARRRRAGRPPRGVVVRRLGRRRRTVVGTRVTDGDRRRLVPFDPQSRLDPWVEGGDELDEECYVVVELAAEGGRQGPGRARVIEVLGPASEPGVDVEVLLREHEIPDEFPPAVLVAAAELPDEPRRVDFGGRRDLRNQVIVTIDGETSRDFDDAISVEKTERGWRLGVHIADVAHYVPEGSELDLEAYRRGTSVYFPDRAVPMLPEVLSNGLCSLRPDVPRLTLSAFLSLDERGKVTRSRFTESVIQSHRRLTYGEVTRLLERPAEGDAAEYGEVLAMLRLAERLMRRLLERRMARGSIDFDLPEGDVILDTEGFTVGVRPGERTVAHRIIEEFMIAANEAVARRLGAADGPGLYRVHEPPAEESLEELRLILAPLGLELRGDLADPQPSALQAVLRRVEGRPEEPFVASLVLRAMQRAVYLPESRGHYALASRHYTHFTSPIRRYPDLVVHRRLKALLGRGDEADAAEALAARLPGIAAHASRTERRAEKAERQLLQWKLVRFLADRVGERFEGRITGVQPFGLFVQLAGYYVDGLVLVRSLADDYYVYDEAAHTLTGSQGGRVFRLADEVEVELTGVSLRHRGLDLKIVGMPEPPPREGRGRRSRPDDRPAAERTGRGRGRRGRERDTERGRGRDKERHGRRSGGRGGERGGGRGGSRKGGGRSR